MVQAQVSEVDTLGSETTDTQKHSLTLEDIHSLCYKMRKIKVPYLQSYYEVYIR